jgi:hypothetical protein
MVVLESLSMLGHDSNRGTQGRKSLPNHNGLVLHTILHVTGIRYSPYASYLLTGSSAFVR